MGGLIFYKHDLQIKKDVKIIGRYNKVEWLEVKKDQRKRKRLEH